MSTRPRRPTVSFAGPDAPPAPAPAVPQRQIPLSPDEQRAKRRAESIAAAEAKWGAAPPQEPSEAAKRIAHQMGLDAPPPPPAAHDRADVRRTPAPPPPAPDPQLSPAMRARQEQLEARRAPPQPIVQPVLADDPAADYNPHLPKVVLNDVRRLPSRGLAYPPNARISYRTYALGELDEFEQSNLTQREQLIRLLQGVETTFPKTELTLEDTLYLGLLRRISTLGTEQLIVQTTCPRCKGSNPQRVATAHIKDDPDPAPHTVTFKELDIPALPVKLKLSFGEHSFRPITIGDYIGLLDQNYELNTPTMYGIQCHSLDFPESADAFRSITDPKDIKLLKKLDEMFDHHLAPLHVTCGNLLTGTSEPEPCGQHYRVSLENAKEAFIYPFRGEDDDSGDEISFGE